MTTQAPQGISLAETYPGLNDILENWMIGAAVFGAVAIIYLLTQWMIARSRMEDTDSGTLSFDLGFITAISLPLILLSTMCSIHGLILGAILGAILALTTYLVLRRHRAAHTRTTP